MREGLQQSGANEAAEEALHAATVSGTEACEAVARRLVVLYRAFMADPGRPYISEATITLGYMTQAQLTHLLERLVQLLLPSAFEQSGLQGVVHERFLRIHEEIRPPRVDILNLLGAPMVVRGEKT